jgi:hypothetical protein
VALGLALRGIANAAIDAERGLRLLDAQGQPLRVVRPLCLKFGLHDPKTGLN